MNLTQSVIVSAFIVSVVWSAALLQPQIATAHSLEEAPQAKLVVAQAGGQHGDNTQKLAVSFNAHTIVGNSDTLDIADVGELWQAFNDNTALHARLKKAPTRVFVAYQYFSNDFKRARISIGYERKIVSLADTGFSLKAGMHTQILAPAKHSPQEIEQAWQTLDYRRPIEQVIEEYQLTENNTLIASNMLVLYGE
ncbi:hypothetical protein [Idiomarina abyssalis]|uniref:hypothetical protein n=1 Tax=Idiomarina abyssalis TaxID=86102 RepID=UPI003A9455FB